MGLFGELYILMYLNFDSVNLLTLLYWSSFICKISFLYLKGRGDKTQRFLLSTHPFLKLVPQPGLGRAQTSSQELYLGTHMGTDI